MFGNTNAPPAVTYSAIIYSLRCMVPQEIPLNQGCLAPITVRIPTQCLLSPSKEAAVVGGNVLTSQRVTDVVLKCFKAAAASQVGRQKPHPDVLLLVAGQVLLVFEQRPQEVCRHSCCHAVHCYTYLSVRCNCLHGQVKLSHMVQQCFLHPMYCIVLKAVTLVLLVLSSGGSYIPNVSMTHT